MSATTRQSLADAISAVDGLEGHKTRPTPPQAGDAWPLNRGMTRGEGPAAAAFETTWSVAIVLGPDEGAAIDQFDELVPKVIDALQAEVFVDSARPLTIPTEAGPLYGVEIIGRSE